MPPTATPDRASRFFVLIDAVDDCMVKKLTASGVSCRHKRLASSPANWATIAELLQHDGLIGALVKLTADSCERLVRDDYADASKAFLSSLSKIQHVVFVEDWSDADRGDEPPPSDRFHTAIAADASQPGRAIGPEGTDVQASADHLLRSHDLNIVSYITSAERSCVAKAFVQDSLRLLHPGSVQIGPSDKHDAQQVGRLPRPGSSSEPARRVLFRDRRTQVSRALLGLVLGILALSASMWSELAAAWCV